MHGPMNVKLETDSSFVSACSCLYVRTGNTVQCTLKLVKLLLSWDIPLCWVNP